jgi:hypothetical protein
MHMIHMIHMNRNSLLLVGNRGDNNFIFATRGSSNQFPSDIVDALPLRSYAGVRARGTPPSKKLTPASTPGNQKPILKSQILI